MPTASKPIEHYTLADMERVLHEHEPYTDPSDEAKKNAAVAMVLRERDRGLETLFIQRAEHPNDPWSGHMAFPGGRQDPIDHTLEHAARRETMEEVALPLDEAHCIGRLHDVYGGRLKHHELAVSPFVYRTNFDGTLSHNYEVADSVWVPLSFLGDPENIAPYKFPLDPLQRDFPSFHYEHYIIWGLTYRIIASFMALFGIILPNEPFPTDVE